MTRFFKLACSLLLAAGLAACASSSMTSPSASGLPHKAFTVEDVVGKSLDVPRGADNQRYIVTFRADGTFVQRGADFSNTGKWNITESGDIRVFVKKGATLRFYGPAADGRYVYVNSNNPKSGTPWVTFQ